MKRLRTLGVCLVLATLVSTSTPLVATPLVNEVMYRAGDTLPEDLRDEWIELHNPTATTIDLSGYQFDNGIEFTFPAVSIPAGGYLVVAADVVEFGANFPAVTNVVGPWIGKLRNSGERIALRDASGDLVDEIDYADEGDWAIRERGVPD
ncbi:MAG: lamin tail domain-containing protein, partial [Verrucomicrobiales bacterium]